MGMRIRSASMVDAEIETGINGISIVFSIDSDKGDVARHLRKTSVWKVCGRLESYEELRVPRDVFLKARRMAVHAIQEKRKAAHSKAKTIPQVPIVLSGKQYELVI